MSLAEVGRFAAQALRGHRLRSLLSLLGVAIGVASVLLLTSLGEGGRRYVTREFASLGTNLIIVIPGKTETQGALPVVGGVPHELSLSDAEALGRRIPQVLRVAPLVIGTAPARFGERSREITVAGTSPAMLEVRRLRLNIGRYLPGGDIRRGQRVCVIGARVQRELFPDTNPLGEILRLGEERFRIIGVIAPRGMSIGMDLDEVVHVPVASAMKMFNRRGLFRILVDVRAHGSMPAVKAAILQILRERHGGEEDVTVLTQDAVLASFNRILAVLTAALAGIAAISLSVAGLGIMNVMLVSVSERTSEVGLLKALGATPPQVLAVFLVEAAILSLSGGFVGLALGLGAGRALALLYPTFPVATPGWAVAGALAVSLGVGSLFGALPARRASRLDPVVALGRR